jgi:hypothetical protein
MQKIFDHCSHNFFEHFLTNYCQSSTSFQSCLFFYRVTVVEADREDTLAAEVVAAAGLLATASTPGQDQQEPADTAETTVPAAAATSTGGEIKKEFRRRKISRPPHRTTFLEYNLHSLCVQC